MRLVVYITCILGMSCVGAAGSQVLQFGPIYSGFTSDMPEMHYLPLAAIGFSSCCIGVLMLTTLEYLDRIDQQ